MTIYSVAKTVARFAEGRNHLAKRILNRALPLDVDFVQGIIKKTQCHFAGRRPRRPGRKSHDMDLASYFLPMLSRQAVMQIIFYENRLQTQDTRGQYRVGDIRFGKLRSLVSHQELLSFGVRLEDSSVVNEVAGDVAIGAYRSFMLVDYTGDWHTLPTQIIWQPRKDEAAFNNHYRLVHNHSVLTKQFVHRNRAESIFGEPYLLLKILNMRLKDEMIHYRCPLTSGITPEADTIKKGEVESVLVPTFTMDLQGPVLQGEYADSVETAYLRSLSKWRSLVQWLMRVDEYAFYMYGLEKGYTAPWIRGPVWIETSPKGSSEKMAEIAIHPKLTLSYKKGITSKKVAA